MDVNPEKLNAFMGKMLGDMGADLSIHPEPDRGGEPRQGRHGRSVSAETRSSRDSRGRPGSAA